MIASLILKSAGVLFTPWITSNYVGVFIFTAINAFGLGGYETSKIHFQDEILLYTDMN